KPNKERHQRRGDEHILQKKSSRKRKPKFNQERRVEIHDERIGKLYARHRWMLYRKVFSEDKAVDDPHVQGEIRVVVDHLGNDRAIAVEGPIPEHKCEKDRRLKPKSDRNQALFA